MAANVDSKKRKEMIYCRNPDDHYDDSEDIAEDPLFDGFHSAEIGSMPELMALLQDEEILERFQDETTANYLRQISMDPSKIESLLNTPQIKYLVDKIKKQYDKTANERNMQ